MVTAPYISPKWSYSQHSPDNGVKHHKQENEQGKRPEKPGWKLLRPSLSGQRPYIFKLGLNSKQFLCMCLINSLLIYSTIFCWCSEHSLGGQAEENPHSSLKSSRGEIVTLQFCSSNTMFLEIPEAVCNQRRYFTLRNLIIFFTTPALRASSTIFREEERVRLRTPAALWGKQKVKDDCLFRYVEDL